MTSSSYAAVSAASAEAVHARRPLPLLDGLTSYLAGTLVCTEMEVRKLRHDPWELVTRAIQPVLWLTIFGEAFSSIHAIPTGGISYLAFMTPGILAQSVMYIAIFVGLHIIWDRDQGILQKLLVMPVPRPSFVTGKSLGAGVRALTQGVAILILAVILGVQLDWSIGGVVGSLLTVVVGAAFFACVSMEIAVLVKTRERFMGLGQVITMPLFFASNAIYPLSIMPSWLQVLARINPLSYMVDLLRGYLVGGNVNSPFLDWAILLGILLVMQIVVGRTLHWIAI